MRNGPLAGLRWGQRLLHAFALGLVSCGGNPLKSIGIGVRTEWVGSPAQRVVQVEFWKPGKCFVIPNGTRVLLNGTPKFVGTVGLDTTKVAVQLTRKLPTATPPPPKLDGRKNS